MPVIEHRATDADAEAAAPPAVAELRDLEQALRVAPRWSRGWRDRRFDAAEIDLEALIHEEVACRAGGSAEGRVHRRPAAAPPGARSALQRAGVAHPALEQLRRIFGPADVRGLSDARRLAGALRAAAARAVV